MHGGGGLPAVQLMSRKPILHLRSWGGDLINVQNSIIFKLSFHTIKSMMEGDIDFDEFSPS